MDDGHVANVDLHEVVLASSPPQLAHSLDERHALDVTNCSSQLNDAHIRLLTSVINRYLGYLLYPFLNRVGNVRDNLYGLAEIVAFSLALDNVLVDFASCDVVVASEGDVEVSLVVAEIEVDFTTIGEHEDLAMPVLFSTQFEVKFMTVRTPWGS